MTMAVLKNFNTTAEEGEISKLFAAFLVTIKVDVKKRLLSGDQKDS